MALPTNRQTHTCAYNIGPPHGRHGAYLPDNTHVFFTWSHDTKFIEESYSVAGVFVGVSDHMKIYEMGDKNWRVMLAKYGNDWIQETTNVTKVVKTHC